MNELRDFITYYCKLNEEELDIVLGKFSYRMIKKGKHILKEGQVCDLFVYNKKGNFRLYYKDKNNKEITTWLVFDDMITTELASFFTQQPTKFYVQAIVDSEIASVTYKDLQKLYQSIPGFQEFGRKIAEEVVVGAINRVVSFQHETADMRYQKIMLKDNYLQKIPLKYLATFLGITDTSFSRLRRKK